MTKLLFRNKWFALVWAISICFTIARFFGEGGGHEKLQVATAPGPGQQAASQPQRNPWGFDVEDGAQTPAN
jgi:hypothetical protein